MARVVHLLNWSEISSELEKISFLALPKSFQFWFYPFLLTVTSVYLEIYKFKLSNLKSRKTVYPFKSNNSLSILTLSLGFTFRLTFVGEPRGGAELYEWQHIFSLQKLEI